MFAFPLRAVRMRPKERSMKGNYLCQEPDFQNCVFWNGDGKHNHALAIHISMTYAILAWRIQS
jgi:hypothetical protein